MIALVHALLAAAASPSAPSATLAPAREASVIERTPRGADSRGGRPTNDLSSLDPEFRTRLERVVARMAGEFGHSVEIVETYRDQSRQETLFAQGRSAPGPVVTWTRNSLHTRGRAADIRVDGRSDECAAYRDLRRVAEAEGLHTLGSRDPGHVEMPRAAGDRAYAWAPPSRGAAGASIGAGVVMTRIVATGGGRAAPESPTVFTRRDRHAEVAEQSDGEYSEPDSEASSAESASSGGEVMVAVEPARRRVPNAEERRRLAEATATLPSAGASVASAARDDGQVMAAVRAAASSVVQPATPAKGRVER